MRKETSKCKQNACGYAKEKVCIQCMAKKLGSINKNYQHHSKLNILHFYHANNKATTEKYLNKKEIAGIHSPWS